MNEKMNENFTDLKHGKNVSITLIIAKKSNEKFSFYWFTYLPVGVLLRYLDIFVTNHKGDMRNVYSIMIKINKDIIPTLLSVRKSPEDNHYRLIRDGTEVQNIFYEKNKATLYNLIKVKLKADGSRINIINSVVVLTISSG